MPRINYQGAKRAKEVARSEWHAAKLQRRRERTAERMALNAHGQVQEGSPFDAPEQGAEK